MSYQRKREEFVATCQMDNVQGEQFGRGHTELGKLMQQPDGAVSKHVGSWGVGADIGCVQTGEMLVSHKKERNGAICRDVHGPRDSLTE